MRWLALAVLGGCSFSPGSLGANDAQGMRDDARLDDASIVDGAADASPDAMVDATFVRPIDIVDARVSGGPHTAFPLLVSIANATWLESKANGGDVERDDGYDIFFSSDVAGTQKLAHDVEVYAAASGTLLAWVSVPSLTAQTVIYLHYGDATITTLQENPTAVWAGYELVFHGDNASGDSTGKTSTFSSFSSGEAAGKFHRAQTFDGVNDRIDAGSAAAIDNIFAGGGTAEGWFFADTFGLNSYGRLFDKGETDGWSLFIIDVDGQADRALGFAHRSTMAVPAIGTWYTPNQSVTAGAWHHAVVVYNKDSVLDDPALYIDGVAQTITEFNNPGGMMTSDAASSLYFGNRSSLDRTFDGLLDELRLSSSSRSADWVATQYRNQSDPAMFYTVGSPL